MFIIHLLPFYGGDLAHGWMRLNAAQERSATVRRLIVTLCDLLDGEHSGAHRQGLIQDRSIFNPPVTVFYLNNYSNFLEYPVEIIFKNVKIALSF